MHVYDQHLWAGSYNVKVCSLQNVSIHLSQVGSNPEHKILIPNLVSDCRKKFLMSQNMHWIIITYLSTCSLFDNCYLGYQKHCYNMAIQDIDFLYKSVCDCCLPSVNSLSASAIFIIFSLLITSAITLDPYQTQQNARPDLDPNYLTPVCNP